MLNIGECKKLQRKLYLFSLFISNIYIYIYIYIYIVRLKTKNYNVTLKTKTAVPKVASSLQYKNYVEKWS